MPNRPPQRPDERSGPVERVSRFGRMCVIDTDQHRGRLYRCPCGVQRWTVWGDAIDHARSCPDARP